MRASINIKYLTFIAFLVMVLFAIEAILSLIGIEESIAFQFSGLPMF
ncbi:MAG: hypothetical protein H8D44_00085 [Actinobacteria bacterium]|nr:hypothetical protein [Actinomycetota bacterium]